MTTMLQQLSVKWMERRDALQYKGKAADRAVLEYFVGAALALELAGHPSAKHVQVCTGLVLATAPYPNGTVAGWAMGKADAAKTEETLRSLG